MKLVYPNETRLFNIAIVLSSLVWAVLIIGTLGIALIYILLFFFLALFVQAGFITYVKGNGVLISPAQFPDLHARLVQCCQKVGLVSVPDTYLLRTDFFNALATRFLRRHYVVLFSDVVDALVERPAAVNFYIGHELGHIQRQHIFWGWVLAPALLLPLLGAAFRRAEEYTCDRYGNACCESADDATMAMAAIVAGNSRWCTLNVPTYLKQVDDSGGFWMSLNELTAEYPWLSKRMAWVVALRGGREPVFPRRHILAWVLACFVPRIAGGAVSFLVIVAIIGILAAVALPAYQDYINAVQSAQIEAEAETYAEQTPLEFEQHLNQANLEALDAELSELRGLVAEYYKENSAYPTNLTDLGRDEVIYSENGGMPISIYENGIIAARFGEQDGQEVYFVSEPLVSEDGSTSWGCWGQNIPVEILPASCQ